MKYRVQVTWLPWLLYALMTVQSVVVYIFFNQNFGKSDDVLLYAMIAAVLWIERNSIMASIRGEGIGHPGYGFAIFCFGLFIYVLGQLFPVMILEVWGLFIMASA
ncbi:MAG: hypothetical protein IE884_08140, partial [Sulfuricurvum sp.]|nr:hypothetical protein [Sulfuricurvum sp.]